MTNRSFRIWLLVLAIPVVILVAAQADTGSAPSIGGGGYDLGPFLYSWLLIIATAIWSMCTLVIALFQRNRGSSRRALVLTAIGLVTLAAVFVFYGDNLS